MNTVNAAEDPPGHTVFLVGSPNVGKSALFNRLTGQYVVVSNYPGTTVEIARGRCTALGATIEVVDTPGMYSLLPITAEEQVACDMLFQPGIAAIIHVIDAKNLERMLGFTLQLLEAGLPVVVALNMFDEALDLGLTIDVAGLQERLGVPVIPVVATTGEGIAELTTAVSGARRSVPTVIDYGATIETGIAAIIPHLPALPGQISSRTHACLLLMGDDGARQRLIKHAGELAAAAALQAVAATRDKLEHGPQFYVALAVRAAATRMLADIIRMPAAGAFKARQFLDRLCTNPTTGIPILLAVLYFGLFKFVGGFGAGTMVDFLEDNLFGRFLSPWAVELSGRYIPWAVLRDLLTGEYGIITLGLRYAIAIILPIVGTFFLVFAILEDSGYLPRLALLTDWVFKRIGLNGRAVIPIALGFGCDTMASLVTRTLETRRERIICLILLALAIPCSAQLGVILGLLGGHPMAMLAWVLVVGSVSLLVAGLAARFMPGEPPLFYMELPPLRLPSLKNVAVKTYARMFWYFKEILPLFLLASLLIWIGRITSIFDLLLSAMGPLMHLLGLPPQAAVAFLFGFFRRDYGAAGLFDLQQHGALSVNQLAVAAVTLTLFLPCVAQFLVMQKEQGTRIAVAIGAGVLAIAFSVGIAMNFGLKMLHISL